MLITGATRLAGVVGAPIVHSLSPTLQNAWIRAAGLDAAYVAFPVPEASFTAFVEGVRRVIRGVNVTAPFKGKAFAIADQVSPVAQRLGAANLLVFESDGAILAENTDGEGLLAAFAEQAAGHDLAAGPAVVIGAGGAARAAAATLIDAGAPQVHLLARSRESAEAAGMALGSRVIGGLLERSDGALAGATTLINATPAGALSQELIDTLLDAAAGEPVVMDMVYRPLRTPLLNAAARRGWPAVDGLAMLIGQGAPSFALLFGQPAPAIDARRLALAATGIE